MALSISIEDARKLIISRQFPDKCRSVGEVVGLIGYVQIDTISIVERAHHHVLWSRLKNYSHHMLDRSLQDERSIFEYWSHAAAFLPVSHYRFTLPRKEIYSKKYRQWMSANRKLVRHIIDRIRAEGPLSSRDFEGKREGGAGWWNHKPAKQALEVLFHAGELMVESRRGFAKYYDLPEKVLPESASTAFPDKKEYLKHIITTAVISNGVATDKQILYLRREPAGEFASAMNELIESGDIVNVAIGKDRILHRASHETLNATHRSTSRKVRILSPFDNLIIQRDRLLKLFGYSYSLECYVPHHKRRFGYYCLPVLKGNEFIGMIDCKAHRDKKEFEVISEYPSGMMLKEFREAVNDELKALAGFAGCNKVVRTKSGRK
ncbi:MAG: winged helix DNA-binding domain-containing protein [Ignavibacteria bacterium]|nr:winged helix DNA-binding domain-containing protein [Ignavibacteria bacterium]